MKNLLALFGVILFFALSVSSCSKDPEKPDVSDDLAMEDLTVSASFNWSTTRGARFEITTLDNQDNPIAGVKLEVLSADPEDGGKLIVSGVTDSQGLYVTDYQVPAYYSSLFVATDYLGLVNLTEVELDASGFQLVLGGSTVVPSFKSALVPKAANAVYKFMGGFNSQGVPDYLEPENDPITADFLDDINNTLPERVRLDISHPEYFFDVYDHNLNLIETCDVWVTFVTEGANYKNVLGFYTYETGNAPQNEDDIDSIKIIFPNASLQGSGGGLQSGNKVYLGRYNANTTISWALIADGWTGSTVEESRWTVYSNKNLNAATDPELKQQTVLLYDPGRERLLLGIEDIRRNSSGCDHDFNDAVFFVTANPVQAIDLTDLPTIDYTGQDGDEDGIPDNFDDYPDDPDKAFDNFFFTEGDYGTLAFEDLWPYRGDYDFNDAVIDYNFNQITNGSNALVEINATFILRAHGAYYHNGFGIEFPFASSAIQSVSGLTLSGNYINLNANGTEAGHSKAVIIIWDDSYEILSPEANGIGANTTPDVPFQVPDTLNVTVKLSEPIPLNQTGVPPYNPFIIVDGQRGVEVHLPNKAPTSLADLSLLGTGHDDSDPAANRYYKTSENLPWAINIVEKFAYPIEKAEIIQAHLKFADWAESGGELYPDWYKNESGYRNPAFIYSE
ncbi:MAG: LruC domain-containing protein [Bacteroidetes bacterium]|nr:LruC domain-containing protein [Bacteroidota bacterium]MBU1580477.1 LruC domain-containing protein [Bacteroidota bacterium]MBU2557729.1 LruC domain-containing protein [Bacteroidota bacterium]